MGFGSLGPLELIIIFLVILLFFGAKRLPEIARGLGKGIREFKSATKEISRELTAEERNQRIHTPPQSVPYTPSASEQEQVPRAPAKDESSS